MKRIFVFICILILLPTPVYSQPTLTIAWTQDVTPEEAQSYIYRYHLDGLSPVILNGVLCGLQGTATECAAPFPIPSIGVHSVYLTASNAYGTSDPSATLQFKYPAVPSAPQNLRIVKGT